MPNDFGVSLQTKLIIDEISESILNESRAIRKSVFLSTLLPGILATIIIAAAMVSITGYINTGEFDIWRGLGASIGLFVVLWLVWIPLLTTLLSTSDVGTKDTELQKRYKEYERALNKYRRKYNQENSSYAEYQVTDDLSEYLSYEERKILNWAIHFFQIESNTNKLVATSMIGSTIFEEFINIKEDELIFELKNLPYDLGKVAKVLEKSGNLAVDHDIEGAESLHTMGMSFYTASQRITTDTRAEKAENELDDSEE